MSSPLQSLLYCIIQKYHDSRKESHVFPAVATSFEIYRDVRTEIDKALAEMVKDGVVSRQENVNGIGMYAPVNAEISENKEE